MLAVDHSKCSQPGQASLTLNVNGNGGVGQTLRLGRQRLAENGSKFTTLYLRASNRHPFPRSSDRRARSSIKSNCGKTLHIYQPLLHLQGR